MSTALELALPNLPDAACRDLPGLFDDSVEGETRKEKARRYAEARMVCQRCPELDACRALVKADESLATGVIVWGGLAFHRPVLTSKNARAISSLPGLDHCQNPACGKPLTGQQRAKRRRNCSADCREAARNARRKPDRPTASTVRSHSAVRGGYWVPRPATGHAVTRRPPCGSGNGVRRHARGRWRQLSFLSHRNPKDGPHERYPETPVPLRLHGSSR